VRDDDSSDHVLGICIVRRQGSCLLVGNPRAGRTAMFRSGPGLAGMYA
jgi:hypothetical protein